MIQYLSAKVNQEFQRNLLDWSLGGPKEGGWTRFGDPIRIPKLILTSCYRSVLTTDQCLAKNHQETLRWHLSFLNGQGENYIQEYLNPRYSDEKANDRIKTFVELLDNIERNKILKPIWVADISNFNLGFSYFRFDGCHRLCCAKFLKIEKVPVLIFRTMEFYSNDENELDF